MRNGGDKLVVTGVGRVRNLGEQHCVWLQALCVYDTQKSALFLRVPLSSVLFLWPFPARKDGVDRCVMREQDGVKAV